MTQRIYIATDGRWWVLETPVLPGDSPSTGGIVGSKENVPATVRPARGLGRLPTREKSTLNIMLPAQAPVHRSN